MAQEIHLVVEHLQGRVADISYVMISVADSLAQDTGMKVTALLLGHDVEDLSRDLAVDQVHILDSPALVDFTSEAYHLALKQYYETQPLPRLLIFGHSSIGMDVASALSVTLDVPLVSQCQRLTAEGDTITFISQICAGKLMAEGKTPEPSAILTLVPGGYRPEYGHTEVPAPVTKIPLPGLEAPGIELLEYLEPDVGDIDITREQILICVGRGLQNQDDLEIVETLAEAMGAAVCASRPFVDLGWLPSSRLVGKSGKHVKPKVYLALGISGAPEHVEGMIDSEMIVAVNTDESAPIFDIAQYGINEDLLDFAEAMTDQLQHSRVV